MDNKEMNNHDKGIKASKIITISIIVIFCAILLFPVGEIHTDGGTRCYGSFFGVYTITVFDPICEELGEPYISFEIFNKQIYRHESK